jgi:type III pantothenate kinase
MLLCDIGNHNVDFYHDGKVWTLSCEEFKDYRASENIYFISVNDSVTNSLGNNDKFINLEPYFQLDTIYQGMGIDRIAACTSVKDGMIVDAGSAITVDIMSNSLHLGGFILAGLSAYEECFANISDKLRFKLNMSVDFEALPQKTTDALSFGVVKPILMILDDTCKDKKIYFTGGDGKFFSKYFKNSVFDRTLIFRGMKKIVEENFDDVGL